MNNLIKHIEQRIEELNIEAKTKPNEKNELRILKSIFIRTELMELLTYIKEQEETFSKEDVIRIATKLWETGFTNEPPFSEKDLAEWFNKEFQSLKQDPLTKSLEGVKEVIISNQIKELDKSQQGSDAVSFAEWISKNEYYRVNPEKEWFALNDTGDGESVDVIATTTFELYQQFLKQKSESK